MPDLLTHLAVGYLISDLRGYDKAVFLLGSVLPDMKVLSVVISPFLADQATTAIFYPLDSLIIFIPLGLMISALFRRRRDVFVGISLAILAHLALDFLQYKFAGGILPLFPLSRQRVSAGLFWQDNYYLTVFAVSGILVLILVRRLHRRASPELS